MLSPHAASVFVYRHFNDRHRQHTSPISGCRATCVSKTHFHASCSVTFITSFQRRAELAIAGPPSKAGKTSYSSRLLYRRVIQHIFASFSDTLLYSRHSPVMPRHSLSALQISARSHTLQLLSPAQLALMDSSRRLFHFR